MVSSLTTVLFASPAYSARSIRSSVAALGSSRASGSQVPPSSSSPRIGTISMSSTVRKLWSSVPTSSVPSSRVTRNNRPSSCSIVACTSRNSCSYVCLFSERTRSPSETDSIGFRPLSVCTGVPSRMLLPPPDFPVMNPRPVNNSTTGSDTGCPGSSSVPTPALVPATVMCSVSAIR